MRVKMLKSAAGPRGSFTSGQEYTVPPDLGREFVRAGAAEELPSLERAVLAAEVETPEKPSPKARARAKRKPRRKAKPKGK